MTRTAIWWVRKDLRLRDNAALKHALDNSDAVIPLLVPPSKADSRAHEASSAWYARSAAALDADLRDLGSRLVVMRGPADAAIGLVAHRMGATLVSCATDPNPVARAEENAVRSVLSAHGVSLVSRGGSLLVRPESIVSSEGQPFRVFTPFFRTWQGAWRSVSLLPRPARIPAPPQWPESEHLPDGPARDSVPASLDSAWVPGETGALGKLRRFVQEALARYEVDRDRPDLFGTSRLSPHLAFGEVSAMTVASTAIESAGEAVALPFLRQLAWREFSYHVLDAFPDLAIRPWRSEFSAMPWREDAEQASAWRSGNTGYPLVDAGMRELAATGWMHNRVRLVVGSFLTKDLLMPWQAGEEYFADRLVDYDAASNAFNWQWVSGSGADASPYFRVFNPWLQGVKFDPDGAYTRRWVPELQDLPPRWIHTPWAAPSEELRRAGVTLGDNYPMPIVDHMEARRRALAAFQAVRAERLGQRTPGA